MYNSFAFVTAIIIASSVLSSVYSFPTLEFETRLDAILPIVQPICFEALPSPRNREINTMNGYAVDSEGRSCSYNLSVPNFDILLNKDSFEEGYANATADFCPPWGKFKECMNEHVNGDKCSADDKEIVLESEFLNIAFALEEQLCNPSIAPRFRNVLKNLANLDILDCVFGGESRQLQDECYGKKFDQDKYHARFQDLGIYFECMKPGVRKCAKGDLLREALAVRVWEELDRAIQDGHRVFWN